MDLVAKKKRLQELKTEIDEILKTLDVEFLDAFGGVAFVCDSRILNNGDPNADMSICLSMAGCGHFAAAIIHSLISADPGVLAAVMDSSVSGSSSDELRPITK